MADFKRSAKCLIQTTIGVFLTIGFIGGIFGDFPEISNDESAAGIREFVGYGISVLFFVIRHYPEGVLLCVLVVWVIVAFLMEPVTKKQQDEFKKHRENISKNYKTKQNRKNRR